MTREEIEKQVTAIVAKQFGLAEENIKLDSRFTTDLGADSLDTVELVMNLEDHFKIEIPEKQAEKLISVQDTADFICTLVS